MARLFLATVSTMLIGVLGCGGAAESPSSLADTAEPEFAFAEEDIDVAESSFITTSHQNGGEMPPSGNQQATSPAAGTRKIIYTSSIDVVVESFDGIASGVLGLCEQHGGFVARANFAGQSGNQRTATWVLRIPVTEYRAFLSAVSDVGEVISTKENSKEVTAEYFDLEARIRNKEREESRLVEILEEQTGKLTDILNVEKEIARVRGEVEQLRGRMRMLKDMTSFSTVTISVREVKNYVPPAAPTFTTEIARQSDATMSSMTRFGADCVLFVVAVGPWVVAIILFSGPFVLIARRIGKKTNNKAVA